MTPRKALFLSAAVLLLIVLSYFYADQSVAFWFHEHLNEKDKEVFIFITQFGESTFYLITFALAALIFHFILKHPAWRNRALFLFAAVAASGIAVNLIKVIAGRYRPSELFEHGLYGFDFFHIGRALTSFPSGHTTTAFALAAAITYVWPKSIPVAWLFALTIGVSRIAIGAHYPSDVLGGALTGTLCVAIILHYWKNTPKLSL